MCPCDENVYNAVSARASVAVEVIIYKNVAHDNMWSWCEVQKEPEMSAPRSLMS